LNEFAKRSVTVVRLERSEAGAVFYQLLDTPDFAALNPGYGVWLFTDSLLFEKQ
jgi:hypothetical protein